MAMRKELLQKVLAVPTRYRQEEKMVKFLKDHCEDEGLDCQVDSVGNVMVTKGRPDFGGVEPGYYPLVCAHTDSVHEPQPMTVVERAGHFIALNSKGKQIGLGGDDKAGVFVCLELLNTQSCLKAAFFVAEEIGCQGSRVAPEEFFDDVGYCISWDSPNNDILTFTCDGTQLFDEHGEFIQQMQPLLETHGVVKWQHHPYTDVSILKRRFDFSCINLPCGYFNMHRDSEYVVVADAQRAVMLGNQIVSALGHKKYLFPGNLKGYDVEREVTGLIC